MRLGAQAADIYAVSSGLTTVRSPTRSRDYVTLAKPRLNAMVLVTTWVGAHLAAPGGVAPMTLLHTLVGTALVAGGASALNQVQERSTDRLMRRTRSRPLPSGRLGVAEGTWFGLLLAAGGLAELALAVNVLCAIVATVTLISYLLVYTPLKTRTSLSTLVGAVPGALPPVIGWSAATGEITFPAAHPLCHRLLLADSSFPGHCVAISRRLRARGHSASACSRARWPAYWTTGTPLRCGAVARQPHACGCRYR